MRSTSAAPPPQLISPAVRARLRRLVLMLSSAHDGEIIAAAAAIGRTLAAAGLDWHALADTVTAAPPADGSARPPDGASRCRRQATWCLRHGDRLLNEREV